MTGKAIVTWIGVVSGLVTILLVFNNPFQNKAKLEAYIETQETLIKIEKDSTLTMLNKDQEFAVTSVVKLTLNNNGELPAKKIHIKFDSSYDRLILKLGKTFKKLKKDEPIYIGNLEPDGEIELFYFNDSYFSSYRSIASDFSISSSDSGKAIIRTEIKGEGVIWFIEEYFIFIVMFLIVLFYLVLITLANLYEKNEKMKAPENSKVKAELDQLSHAWSLGVLNEEEFKIKGKELLEKGLGNRK
jgi:hypothetical protein